MPYSHIKLKVIPLFTKLGYSKHRERGVEQLPSQSIGTLPIWLILALGFTPLIPGLVPSLSGLLPSSRTNIRLAYMGSGLYRSSFI